MPLEALRSALNPGGQSLLRKFETNQVFSEHEAWMLFRIAAIGEAVGWSLLGFGIVFERYIAPGNQIAVQLAGQVHGLLFIFYMLAAAGLYPALGWPRWRAAVALLASVPPFGSLLFEQWMGHRRNTAYLARYSRCLLVWQLARL